MQTISNKQLTIKIADFGAELTSIIKNDNNKEYLWQADPAFWKRHSPVLFPIVGSLWNGEYHHNGQSYKMSQHGFARDYDFILVEQTESEVLYRLTSNEETRKVYPFHFELHIGYKLVDNKLEVIWKVKNTGDSVMHFQIGAHPAFFYPDFNSSKKDRGYFAFDATDNLEYILIKEKGCVDPTTKYPLELNEEGLLLLDTHTFDKNALVLENSQVKKVTLLDMQKRPQITLHFDAPLVGLWAPSGKDSPFVCIEPWYGRCDRVEYTGEYKDRDWVNYLESGDVFSASYIIEVE